MNDSKLARINKDLEKKIKQVAKARIILGVDEEIRSLPEMTRMMQNCKSFPKMIEELASTPRKEDMLKFK